MTTSNQEGGRFCFSCGWDFCFCVLVGDSAGALYRPSVMCVYSKISLDIYFMCSRQQRLNWREKTKYINQCAVMATGLFLFWEMTCDNFTKGTNKGLNLLLLFIFTTEEEREFSTSTQQINCLSTTRVVIKTQQGQKSKTSLNK